ncbi:MAG TPA: DUF3341 domain-containing protein [Terriglobia bacterium]|nr:DUF3341 domain-containing protein [Terriglobia bacterium]
MSEKNVVTFGIYPYYSSVEHAVEALQAAEIRNTNISVLFPKNAGSMNFAREVAAKLPGGSMGGAGTGAVVDGTLEWLAGFGTLAIPGLGQVIAAGPIMVALAGVGAEGALGRIAAALMSMEIPEYIAKRYERRVKDGGILASVHTVDSIWTKRARKILARTGAQDITSTREARAEYTRSEESRMQSATGDVRA